MANVKWEHCLMTRPKEPTRPYIEHAGVDAEVWRGQARVGKMEETILRGHRKIFAYEVVSSHARLQIIFECRAQVSVSDTGGSCPSAPVDKWHPARMRAEIVAQHSRSADHIGDIRIELRPLEDLSQHLPVPAVPSI